VCCVHLSVFLRDEPFVDHVNRVYRGEGKGPNISAAIEEGVAAERNVTILTICVHSSASPSCDSLVIEPVHLSVTTVAEGFVVGVSATAEVGPAAVEGLAVGTPDLDLSSQEQRAVDGRDYPELLPSPVRSFIRRSSPRMTLSLKFVCLWLLSHNGLLRHSPQRQRATRVSSSRVSPSGFFMWMSPRTYSGPSTLTAMAFS
jgi:hypothetical protein